MDTHRTPPGHTLPSPSRVAEMCDGESIVDRLFAIPVPALDPSRGTDLFETGVARLMERRVAEKMRERLTARG